MVLGMEPSADANIELGDVSLHRSGSSRENGECLCIEDPIGESEPKREEDVPCILPNIVNMEQRFNSMTALEILRETIRVLRLNSVGFMAIAALLICPVSAILLSNAFVDQFTVESLSLKFQALAEAIGLPKGHFTRSGCHKLSETILSFAFCFPFFITFLLFSKAVIVYSVALSYASKKLSIAKFLTLIRKIWKRVVLTYLWTCLAILVCVGGFILLLVMVVNVVLFLGIPSTGAAYAVLALGVIFSLLFAHTMIVCHLAMVVSIFEDCWGLGALTRSMILIKGRTQVGLWIFLGTSIGTAFVESLFDHRVKTLSYGDGSSRIWEGPLLVIMYSFVILIDAMMSCIFFFTCKCCNSESFDSCSLLEHTTSFSIQTQQNYEHDTPESKMLFGSD